MTIGLASPGTLRLKRRRSPCFCSDVSEREDGLGEPPASGGWAVVGGGVGPGAWATRAGAAAPPRTTRAGTTPASHRHVGYHMVTARGETPRPLGDRARHDTSHERTWRLVRAAEYRERRGGIKANGARRRG